jgi:hypothetical protein
MRGIGAAAGPAPDGPVPPHLRQKLDDPVAFGLMNANVMLLLGIIWNMITKPGMGESFFVLAVFVAIGILSAAPSWARSRSRDVGAAT